MYENKQILEQKSEIGGQMPECKKKQNGTLIIVMLSCQNYFLLNKNQSLYEPHIPLILYDKEKYGARIKHSLRPIEYFSKKEQGIIFFDTLLFFYF